MNILWINTQTGATDTAPSGSVVDITVEAGVPVWLYLRCETAFSPASGAVVWSVAGDLDATTPDERNEVQSGGTTAKIAAMTLIAAPTPGLHRVQVIARVATEDLAGCYFLAFAITALPPAGGAPIGWALPAELCDLQFDFRSRQVLSPRLAAAGRAIKAGDDLRLGVVPSIDGVPVTSLVTAVKVSIRRKDRPFTAALAEIEETGAPLAPLDVSGSKYWLIEMPLTGQAVDDLWAEINGIAAADAATEAQLAATRGVECDLEVRVTWDGDVYTGHNMAFTLLQAIGDAPTEV